MKRYRSRRTTLVWGQNSSGYYGTHWCLSTYAPAYGCEKKVKKTLSHLKGIYSVTVDYSQQKVTVWGICNKYDVLSTMRSKRKEARFWKPEDNIEMEDDQAPTPSLPRKESNKPSLALMKARSLSWKAWKKVFTRSYSF